MYKMISGLVLALVLCVPMACWMLGVQPPSWGKRRPTLPPIIRLQEMNDLVTMKVHISDYLEGENDHYIGRWTLHGEALLGVDLGKAQYVEVDQTARTAALVLCTPCLISSKADPDRSEEMYIKAKVWVPTSSRKVLRDEVWKQADHKIQRLGQHESYLETTKLRTEKVLTKLFDGLGWKVSIRWSVDGGKAPSESAPSQHRDA